MADKSLNDRVAIIEQSMDGKTLKEHFREHGELMDRRFAELNARFSAQDKRFDAIDARFISIDKRFEAIDARFISIDKRFEAIDAQFVAVHRRFESIDERFNRVDHDLSLIRRDLGLILSKLSAT